MLTRPAALVIVTNEKMLSLPPPNAFGIRLVPASSANKGGYPLTAFINNVQTEPVVIAGPSLYVHHAPITKLEVNVAPGGGVAGDQWALEVQPTEAGCVVPYPFTSERGSQLVAREPGRALFAKAFDFSSEVAFQATGAVRRVYLLQDGSLFAMGDVAMGTGLWDLRHASAVTFAYDAASLMQHSGTLESLELFAELYTSYSALAPMVKIAMGSANAFAGVGGAPVAGSIIIDPHAPELVAASRARVAERPLFGLFYFRYKTTGAGTWTTGGIDAPRANVTLASWS